MRANRFYVTTPIYYINDVPHLGTAYTTIVADALARYQRARGRDVHFLTGTDEHGEKVEEAARNARLSPRAHADRIVRQFKETWPKLDVASDDFIRTTEPRHAAFVEDMWKRMDAAGDIYLGHYDGLYCIGCEAYVAEGELEDGKCKAHGRAPERRQEPSYFFRLAKYQQPLLDFYRDSPGFIRPESRKNEVVSFVAGGLRDLSISRTSFTWGIPVPGDPAHVVYVWVDALANYVSALGGPGGELYRRYWPADVHLIGKDILRFHAVYWPAMLMSAGLPPPACVFAHGWWSVTGKKISKSLPATRISPTALADDVGVDALRYFLLRELPLGQDGDFSYESLVGRINADLANDLGNLLSRALAMVDEYTGGVVPEPDAAAATAGDETLRILAESARDRAAQAWEDLAPSRALEATWELVRAANRYIVENEPWTLRKSPGKEPRLATVLYTLLEAVRVAAELCAPAMPRAAARIREQLGLPQATQALWPKWGDLAAGLQVRRGAALFPRIDKEREQALLAKWAGGLSPSNATRALQGADRPAAGETGPPPAAPDGKLSYEEFSKIDLRVAIIVAAERVKDADRLLKLTVDLGGETRQIVAGIATSYAAGDLVGRRVIVVANLKPAKIRGERSEGMILAAGEKDALALATFDREVAPGAKVK
ncbi:MAG: methionine--tRNA ligase [Myxococcota bacterium]